MKKLMKKAAILAAMAMIAQLVIIPGMAMAEEPTPNNTGAPIGWGPVANGAGLGIADNTKGNQKLGWAEGNNLAAVKAEAPVEEPAAPAEGEAVAAPAEGEEVVEAPVAGRWSDEQRIAYWQEFIEKYCLNGFCD